MKTIEITAEVQADGKLTVQLPPGISPGYHRIVLVIDERVIDEWTTKMVSATKNSEATRSLL